MLWRDAQCFVLEAVWFRTLAQRAARASATHSVLLQGQFHLLVSTRCAAGAGATRSVALFF
ncbi:hypothetical protein A2U01_0046175 [Trifolium medium]|uniref:Uncharacterized protein n=1 Tax=Trifolium medium TaxID=97028 RepID=A0A392QM19_9FABA|nr:hypothetical protein [Trifolium medium]